MSENSDSKRAVKDMSAWKSYKAEEVEKDVIGKLKDFQRATVDHIIKLFAPDGKEGNEGRQQKRVLVADEVGLGKTIIARGVIARLAKIRHEAKDDRFNVVYVCSNQSIANQNISKLGVGDAYTDNDVTGTRLSMQHLKIAQLQVGSESCTGKKKKRSRSYIQLIPLTPGTSFNVKSGCGTAAERALMCVILKKVADLGDWEWKILKEKLKRSATEKNFGQKVDDYTKAVEAINGTSNPYPASFIKQLLDLEESMNAETPNQGDLKNKSLKQIVDELIEANDGRVSSCIQELRFRFALASVKMLEPDLIIMDEFQRFSTLLAERNDESEAGILAREFLSDERDGQEGHEGHMTRILLLSATPYKSYSTRDEIDFNNPNDDVSEKELKQLLGFLFKDSDKSGNEGDGARSVVNVWDEYSKALRNSDLKDNPGFIEAKCAAEEKLYGGMCRTERLSVMDPKGTISNDCAEESLTICEGDVRTYIEFNRLLEKIGVTVNPPVEYVKSCPYLLSFLGGYELRNKIVKGDWSKGFGSRERKNSILCVSKDAVNVYKQLIVTNSRFRLLLEHAFGHATKEGGVGPAAQYIWLPPTLPYYSLEGAYKGAYKADGKQFSKVLVFSAWEMVPRMISTLVSYEAERATVGRLRNRQGKKFGYLGKNGKRRPQPRLKFEKDSLSLFTLLYPSKTLAEIYNPMNEFRDGRYGGDRKLEDLKQCLKNEIKIKLEQLGAGELSAGEKDESWYYLAPMLLDGTEYALGWCKKIIGALTDADAKKDNTLEVKCYGALKAKLGKIQKGEETIGPMPVDLAEVLAEMALGSPAVCVRRSWTGIDSEKFAKFATQIARSFFTRFNTPEGISIIDNGNQSNDAIYWKDVVRYCMNGCLQAVVDEYMSALKEECSFDKDEEKRAKNIAEGFCNALEFRTTSYDVDTWESFDKSGSGDGRSDGKGTISMRSHYAVGLVKGKGEEGDVARRKDNLRRTFNSPFRPFVLASTSVGQEGLDFHPYCRKVFHWNLPTNPVDLEQREGRVNRFKCLAVRESIVADFVKNGAAYLQGRNIGMDGVWDVLYGFAQWQKDHLTGEELSGDDKMCDLMPFWCYKSRLPGKDGLSAKLEQSVKIERIVPKYPFSRDEVAFQKLMDILSMYRITLGQPRQEELIESLRQKLDESSRYREYFINLCPFLKDRLS